MNEKDYHIFHGYKIYRSGQVFNAKCELLKTDYRKRLGGGKDVCIRLRINKKSVKFTLARLVLQCFKGPGYGLEANHKDRNPLNNHIDNLEWVTPSENQYHWRKRDKEK